MTATAAATRVVPSRPVELIVKAPPLHWVGDGFRVAGYFSAIPDAATRLDPFLMLDYHPPFDYSPRANPRGVGVHPHRGFETVTLAFEGSVAHHDSAGGGGVIGPGDAQWMTAAAGVLHKEYHEAEFTRRGGRFHMAQLWVNLPRQDKMGPPRYQALTAGEMGQVALPDGAGHVRVIAGGFAGVTGPAKTFSPVTLLDITLAPGGQTSIDLPPHHTLAIVVMDGEVRFGDEVARKEEFVLFARTGERVDVTATTGARLLVMAGEPIGEPIVQYGPFVMNTRQEIVQAMRDFEAGKFGHLED